MKYEASFKDKDAAWFVYRRLQGQFRHQNSPDIARMKIRDSRTIVLDDIEPTALESIATTIQAKYWLERKA